MPGGFEEMFGSLLHPEEAKAEKKRRASRWSRQCGRFWDDVLVGLLCIYIYVYIYKYVHLNVCIYIYLSISIILLYIFALDFIGRVS